VIKFFFSFIFSLCIFNTLVYAQDIEKITKAKFLKVNGGIGTDQVFYNASGIDARRNAPYQYYFTGNINATILGEIKIPLSFSFSNQKFNYAQPTNQQQFNRFGISPKYRWITVHAGWRSMNFSPYSLNGHTFLGGGVELRPGKWTIAAMYGRLLKAVNYDSIGLASGNKPAYQRMAMGFNAKYENNGNQYGVSLFRSTDNPTSIHIPLDSIGVTPEENIVWSVLLKQKLSAHFTVDGEFANSTLTTDSRVRDETKQKELGVIQENSSTRSYNAFKIKATQSIGKAHVGIGLERIDPGYRTHGSYYFNNDLQSITALFAAPFFKEKVNLSVDVGQQKNNLDNSKVSTMKRWVSNVNIGYQVNKKVNLTATYSNFQSYTNMRSQFTTINSNNPYANIDTLNYVQITQSAGLISNVIFVATEKRQQLLNFNVTAQKSGEQQGEKTLPTGTVFYNSILSYVYGFVPINVAFTLALNGNWNQLATGDTKTYGPTIGVSKSLFKKLLKTSLNYSWNTTTTSNVNNGYIGNLRFNNTLVYKKKHNFTLSLVWLSRNTKNTTQNAPAFNENTVRFSYNYRF
jgi:hypothetical protein